MKLIEDRKQFTKELRIIKKEVASFDISRYEPTQKVLDKIEDYKNRNSRVNVKAITSVDKLLTYYYAAAILGYDSLKSDIGWELAVSRFTRPYRGSEVWRSVFPELRLRMDMSEFNELNDYEERGGRGPDQEFIYGILDKIETAAKQARKIDENQKITLTLGQLKKLVKESNSDSYPPYNVWARNVMDDIIDELKKQEWFDSCDYEPGTTEQENDTEHCEAIVNVFDNGGSFKITVEAI